MTDPVPPRQSAARVAARYIVGRPLDGSAPTSSYLRPGATGGRWARLPGWQRQAWRLGVPTGVCVVGQAYAAHPTLTAATGALVAAGAAVDLTARARNRWVMRRITSTYVRPTLAALTGALGDAPVRLELSPDLAGLAPRVARPMSPAEVAARAWYGEHVEPVVRWAPDRVMRAVWCAQQRARRWTRYAELFRVPAEPAAQIRLVTAVPYLTVEQRQYVSAVIGAKLPGGDMVERWDMVGTSVTATWTIRRRPPARVGYADLAARLEQLAEWEFFLGLGAGGKPVVVSLKDDSPHIALSAGSGAGKSVLAQAVAVQVLARGGRVVILDIKGSHRWALGMPGVDYCVTAEQQHQALIRLAAMADERNQLALHEDEDWDPGPRVLVIAEELNATFQQLRDYWAEIRERGAPTVSPAVKAFRRLLFMGRSAKANVLAIAQMLTAHTTGGPESRENFGVRCLARYTANNWKMLVPEASMPRASRTLGRWQIVVGGVATECQVVYLSAAEARLIVAKYRGVPVSPPDARSPLMGADLQMSPGHGDSGDVSDPRDELVTLRQAVERRLVPWQFDAAKKRLQRGRAGGRAVPVPVGRSGTADLYRVGDVVAWVEAEMVAPEGK